MSDAHYTCPHCDKTFPYYYKNKGAGRLVGYWGNGQKYNYRGAASNFDRHTKACKIKQEAKLEV